MKIFIKTIGYSLYTLFASCIILLSGCKTLTPTRVPPFTEELGYHIPNYKNWTLTGISESVVELESLKLEIKYEVDAAKLKALGTLVESVNAPFYLLREEAINWFNIALSGGLFGGLPLALRKLPRGAIRKEQHDLEVKKAGYQDPDEFRRNEDRNGD